jgi:hypothetical protein
VGKEPYLVIVLAVDESIECVFTVSDTLCLTTNSTIKEGLLDLFALYYTTNLDYPSAYELVLGLFQSVCMGIEFKGKVSPEFVKLRESLKD